MFTAARRLDGLILHVAILEADLHPHLVAITRTKRGDGGILDDIDEFRHLDALGIGHHVLRELRHESIAFEQEGRNAVGQVELGGGEPLRLVGPAHMVCGDARAMDDDILDISDGEGATRLNVADAI